MVVVVLDWSNFDGQYAVYPRDFTDISWLLPLLNLLAHISGKYYREQN